MNQKSKMAAGLLGIFLGAWGVHQFYLGDTKKGIIRIVVSLVTCGIRNALTELGLRIPEEISLISLGESGLFSILRPALTTVRSQEPPGGFVVKAVEILMDRLQNPSHLCKIVNFGTPQVMVRESTRFLRREPQKK